MGSQFGAMITQDIYFAPNPPPPPPSPPPPPPVGIMPQLNFTANFLNLTLAGSANISNFQARCLPPSYSTGS